MMPPKAIQEKAFQALKDGKRDALIALLEEEGRKSNNYLYIDASMDSLIQALDPKWEGPQPHTILVAPGGEIVFRHNGLVTEDDLLDKLLNIMSKGYQP